MGSTGAHRSLRPRDLEAGKAWRVTLTPTLLRGRRKLQGEVRRDHLAGEEEEAGTRGWEYLGLGAWSGLAGLMRPRGGGRLRGQGSWLLARV